MVDAFALAQIATPPDTGPLERWLIGGLLTALVAVVTMYWRELLDSRKRETERADKATTALQTATESNKGMREVIDRALGLQEETAANITAIKSDMVRVVEAVAIIEEAVAPRQPPKPRRASP